MGNPKRGDRRLQPRHGDIFEEDRTDQMKCEEFTLLLFKIQDPQKVGAAGDYHGELFVCQRGKKEWGVLIQIKQCRDMLREWAVGVLKL